MDASLLSSSWMVWLVVCTQVYCLFITHNINIVRRTLRTDDGISAICSMHIIISYFESNRSNGLIILYITTHISSNFHISMDLFGLLEREEKKTGSF